MYNSVRINIVYKFHINNAMAFLKNSKTVIECKDRNVFHNEQTRRQCKNITYDPFSKHRSNNAYMIVYK